MKTNWTIYKSHLVHSGWCRCPICEQVSKDLARCNELMGLEKARCRAAVIKRHNGGRISASDLEKYC